MNKAKGRNKIGKQLGRKRVAAEVAARARRQGRNLQRAGAAKGGGKGEKR